MCRGTPARWSREGPATCARGASFRAAPVRPSSDTRPVITAGVDLAAEAKGTAVAVLSWEDSRAVVTSVAVGAEDEQVLDVVRRAHKVGVDCPFGWPTAFARLVSEHQRAQLGAPPSSGREWRRGLTMRLTDQHVQRVTGLTPLSVSADRIAHAALRWAAIAATVAASGLDASRDGSGLLAEVYPAAALRGWGLPYRGYKGPANRSVRDGLVDGLLAGAPWLDLAHYEDLCRSSDHALDSVLCALVARAAACGMTQPADRLRPEVAEEGWIHLPTVPLEVLIRSP